MVLNIIRLLGEKNLNMMLYKHQPHHYFSSKHHVSSARPVSTCLSNRRRSRKSIHRMHSGHHPSPHSTQLHESIHILCQHTITIHTKSDIPTNEQQLTLKTPSSYTGTMVRPQQPQPRLWLPLRLDVYDDEQSPRSLNRASNLLPAALRHRCRHDEIRKCGLVGFPHLPRCPHRRRRGRRSLYRPTLYQHTKCVYSHIDAILYHWH